MTRHFLSIDAQARYTEARLQAIRRLGILASEHGCDFMTVAGDVFESNQVDRGTVARACDAMAEVPVPVLLLPGNHDPLDASSVFTSQAFLACVPANVTVLTGEVPIIIGGVEVISAPWRSKRPLHDLTADALAGVRALPGTQRVLVAHGPINVLSPNPDDPALIYLADLETAVADGLLDFVCLGDRHSVTNVGSSGRVWYSGTPEVTDFLERDSGQALIIDLGANEVLTRNRQRVQSLLSPRCALGRGPSAITRPS